MLGSFLSVLPRKDLSCNANQKFTQIFSQSRHYEREISNTCYLPIHHSARKPATNSEHVCGDRCAIELFFDDQSPMKHWSYLNVETVYEAPLRFLEHTYRGRQERLASCSLRRVKACGAEAMLSMSYG